MSKKRIQGAIERALQALHSIVQRVSQSLSLTSYEIEADEMLTVIRKGKAATVNMCTDTSRRHCTEHFA